MGKLQEPIIVVTLPPLEGEEYEVSKLLDDVEAKMTQALYVMDSLTADLLVHGGLSTFDELRILLQELYRHFDEVDMYMCDEEILNHYINNFKYILRRFPAIFRSASVDELRKLMQINTVLNEAIGRLESCREYDLPFKKKQQPVTYEFISPSNEIANIYEWSVNSVKRALYGLFN